MNEDNEKEPSPGDRKAGASRREPPGDAAPAGEPPAPEAGAPGAPREGGTEASLELVRKAEERDAYRDELLRARADLDNFRKRVQRERPAWEEQAVRRLVRDLLPVVDNFERAMESLKTAAGDRADRDKAVRLEEGIRLIHHMMRRALADHGVEEIVAVGRQFDPEMHEAMAQEETADHPTGEVLEVLEKGYRHRDVVVRPSKVKVAVNVRDAQEGVRGGRAGEREAE